MGEQSPIVIAYDGSDLARHAIEQAGRQLGGRETVVLTVWQPADVGFVPPAGTELDATRTDEVGAAAEATAEEGAALAAASGFRARGATVEAAPIWQGIVDFAKEHEASLIVLGSHCPSGLSGIFIGSVATAVTVHGKRPVMIVPRAG
jgi:nucleotide-binding universal stress UspA family protein